MHLALLKRAMRFSAVANNLVVARVASVLVSIAFGLAGWGYWALVMGPSRNRCAARSVRG